MIPTPVFESYWRFARERQSIYERRLRNRAGPWSDDPILNTYRFTNVFRAADRVSQYLIAEIQSGLGRPQSPRELFFRTVLFKLFNKIETWELLEKELGPTESADFDYEKANRLLDRLMAEGKRVYSAAYIMPAPPYGHPRKHANHLELLRQMMEARLPERLTQLPSLAYVYDCLLGWPGLGRFLAFQFTIDLNYSSMLSFGESDFVVAGPGAMDGIAKCFSELNGLMPEQVIMQVYENQEQLAGAYGLSPPTLFGRRLQPIDCQNLFCEISKYARVAHPEIVGTANRTRIKQKYHPDAEPVPCPVFPADWNLGVRVTEFLAADRPARKGRTQHPKDAGSITDKCGVTP